ncbi:MAG: class I SAM-dependent methyltransferase, partial [Acidobacteria bacterium]|nr:class I SAM-dependent methyltransferase [Acidobacteriota bacterium]
MKEGVYLQYGRVLEEHWWTQARRRLVMKLLKRMGVEPDGSRRVLEIGAGAGTEFSFLSRFGSVVAVELSPVGASLCRQRGYEDVIEGDLNQYVPPTGHFDIVVDFNVLYHRWISEPGSVL